MPQLPAPIPPKVHEQSRRADVLAWLALVSGLISLVTCFGAGLVLIAPPLPLLPLILGLVALAESRRSERPARARAFAWVGIAGGSGALVFALLLAATLIGSVSFMNFYSP